MSEVEDPAVTVARLLQNQVRVVLDNNALASVNVSGEYLNSDALKVGDGQVTVALSESVDQKIDLSGKIRRRMSTFRVNVWTTDTSNALESGKSMRTKIVEAINSAIRQNRSKPNETVYAYVGLGPGGQGSKAFCGDTEAAPDGNWTELSLVDYQNLWYSDDNNCQITQSGNGAKAVLLFGFKVESRRNTVKQAVLSFEGYGSASGIDGVTVKAWNRTVGAWQNSRSSQEGERDEVLTVSITANLADFIDDEGYIWFIAETNGASDGVTPAVLNCDSASCSVTVNGMTYLDVASYRNLDRVDIKPPIYRTEFTVKSWFIENIEV